MSSEWVTLRSFVGVTCQVISGMTRTYFSDRMVQHARVATEVYILM